MMHGPEKSDLAIIALRGAFDETHVSTAIDTVCCSA
jgi:hypothetical protein